MPILASEALFHENKKILLQNATLVSIEPLDLWFQVQQAPLYTKLTLACKTETLSSLYSHALLILTQQAPLYTKLTLACKTETLSSLYSHALLILTKSSKSRHQVVHEQKFKDLLSSTCQVSVERSMLDLGSEVQWFNTHWGNIWLLEFFVFT